MQSFLLKVLCLGLIGMVGLTGCAQNEVQKENVVVEDVNEIKKEPTISSGIVINEIENLASAKIMAESKVIEKDNLPEDLKYLTELNVPNGIKLNMISELYTKSDMTKEEFDVLHDFEFLFSNDDSKTIMIKVSKFESTLRDYFFQASNNISLINETDVVISRYENRYIATFSYNGIQYDVETNNITQEEFINLLEEIVKNSNKQKFEENTIKKSSITKEMAYEGVSNYCYSNYDWSHEESSMYVAIGEESATECQIIFRSYTGAFMYFYVDKSNGTTRMVEYIPTLDIENEAGTINLYDYLKKND